MKKEISWHKNNVKNSTIFLEKKKLELEKLKDEIQILEYRNNFYSFQIQKAEEKNIDGFDRYKFSVPKRSKK